MQDKLTALVHLVVHECAQYCPGRFGSVRLNKTLWFADVAAYHRTGSSITGEVYIKKRNGPVAKTYKRTLQALEEEGKLRITPPSGPYEPWRYESLAYPPNDVLSAEEIEYAKAALRFVCDHSVNDIIQYSHGQVWDAAQIGEELPMYATLAAGDGPITDEVIAWASEQAENSGEQEFA